MSQPIYTEFFYRKINDNLSFNVIRDYYEQHDNNGPYEGQMYCPECWKAALKFVPRTSRSRAYLSAIDANEHMNGCSCKYECSSTKTTKAYFDHLTEEQVEDKMASALRMMSRKNERDGHFVASRLNHPNDNPFILSEDKGGRIIRRTLPCRSLNKPLDIEEAGLLCAFYARNVCLSVKTVHKESEDGEPYDYHILKVHTDNGKKYQIYRGRHLDVVSQDGTYNIVLIGSFQAEKLYFSEQRIDLIKKGNPPHKRINQSALKYEKATGD